MAAGPIGILAALILGVLGIGLAVVIVIYLFVPVAKGIGWLFKHIFDFVFGMIADTLRAVGAVVTAVVFTPLILLNVIIGRWSAASHFGRGLTDEMRALGHCVYRVAIGHPARFLLLSPVTEGLERRLPQAVANAPTRDRPARGKKSNRLFEGYTIVGSLPGGGSGGKLYVAQPSPVKLAAFMRQGKPEVDQVVIKAFYLDDGSSLPQIIRESRALEAAKKLGLVLDHELTDERFFYAMEYVPGDPLTIVTQRLHDASGRDGLNTKHLREALAYVADLLDTLNRYHHGGLWHKDVKPDNIIVHDGAAHLVDLGLITPLRSAMTLTTHGTEYFRDPEMVRMALRGAKVHEVDGVKFDVYGAGAVLYSIVEASFPAHGGLSQMTKQCPDALRWVIRRSMAEMNKRYASAGEMLSDIEAIINASDPFAMKPKDLPSMSGGGVEVEPIPEPQFDPDPDPEPRVVAAAAGSPTPRRERAQGPEAAPHGGPSVIEPRARRKPRIHVTDWWSGRYRAAEDAYPSDEGVAPLPRQAVAMIQAKAKERPTLTPVQFRAPAREQVHAARSRAHKRRQQLRKRAAQRAGARNARYKNGPNVGVVLAILFMLGFVGLLLVPAMSGGSRVEGHHHAAGVTAIANDQVEFHIVDADGSQRSIQIVGAPAVSGSALNVPGASVKSKTSTVARQMQTELRGHPMPVSAPTAPPVPDTPAAGAVESARVLVVDRRGPELDADVEGSAIVRLAQRLRDAGHDVFGMSNEPTDIDAVISVERARGMHDVTSPDGREAILSWLRLREEAGEVIDALLWVPREEGVTWTWFERPHLDPAVRADLLRIINTTP